MESTGSPVGGMESVVATVSGYHGNERFNLIKLINHAGASYVGSMSRSITHLVCWKLEGRKFDIAMRLNTIVVNHRWVEDCIKQGKRVPEEPYMLQSGQEVGALMLEYPHVPEVDVQKVLSDKSNTCYGSQKQSVSMGLQPSEDTVLHHSSSLTERVFSDFYNLGKSSRKSKRKLVKSNSEQELHSSSRCSFQESPLSELLRNQQVESSFHSSMNLARDKRKSFNGNRSSKPETSRKGRRLIKRIENRDIVELCSSDSNQDCCPARVDNPNNEAVTVLSNHVDGEPYDEVLENDRASGDGLYNRKETRNEGSKDVGGDAPNCIAASASMDPNVCTENAVSNMQRTSEDGCSGAKNPKEDTTKELEIKHSSEIPSSRELSCVICWTDFSSTRGVLPCGHRFCYSCIENWADHMASRRKISTCPLCKTSFSNILKFKDAATSEQKIYSQTVPCGLSTMDMFILHDQDTLNASAQSESAAVCSVCHRLEPVDLLIICNVCQIRRIHSYCLDPPVDPWTCIDCKDLQRLYLLNR
ncbi:Cdk-activating kinase assembly factor [Trema orientale]|uniref:Cdk-activating kinase assembly factor n=1 Tax=Trema orientale TaxID=63057 RepID=A0A2P5BAP6_TREOI|nr:Cdk-activating kinase assembly factor [Trema orientale]